MYKQNKHHKTKLKINQSTEDETLETKIERMINNKEQIKGDTPLLFTMRSEGVNPSTNIKTDRFEIAVEATDKIAKSYKARREENSKVININKEKNNGEAESIDGNNQ